MRICLLLAVIGPIIGFALPTFAQQKDTVDPQIAAQIRAVAVKYVEAADRQDPVAVAAIYAQDGVNVTPHEGIFHGRQSIEKHYAEWDFQLWHAHRFFQDDQSGSYGWK
jgi:ketosteroid isomerase-like protein